MKDLVVLVADKNTEMVLRTLLSKRQVPLGIRAVSFDIFVHPRRDPGMYQSAADFLRSLQTGYHYALIVFDREGCGADGNRQEIQNKVQDDLNRSDWRGRSAVVVIDPELEAWVFSGSSHVVQVLANGDQHTFEEVVRQHGGDVNHKPDRPKEAVEVLLKRCRKPRSSALYGELAEKVSLMQCSDPSFSNLRDILQEWFPQTGG